MASIILSAVGTVAGTAIGGPAGAAIGAKIGSAIGGQIDSALFSESIHREGRRLEELSVQTSGYGLPIPLIYGIVRIGGNIIWAQPLKEVATTTTQSGGKGGGGSTATSTNYSYYASFAVAICEGEIDAILRVWADTALVDISRGTYRIYYGDEDQLPDPLIQSIEGSEHTPAHRGLAYLVVEDFPLEAFGNRIPNFTFEVRRNKQPDDIDGQPLEHHIKSMMIIPGAGEYVYDTVVQSKTSGNIVNQSFIASGFDAPLNAQNNSAKANAIVAVDQLLETCPNLEWVGVVVSWFGSSLDAGQCTIRPAVDFKIGNRVTPTPWQVAGYNRSNAPLISFDDNRARYGGSPCDASLIRFIDMLKSRGLKVMLLPMFFMDLPDKPWRGRVTGSAAEVENFFTRTQGYNAFITHYANLTKQKVDAFVIGSELVGLTAVHDDASINRQFPAVNKLIQLANSVKTIMGESTDLTYAADWSEYHHADGGWYHLDPLWASPAISFVGIDAYFPLTNAAQEAIERQDIVDGWTSGEGWSFYYSDAQRTQTQPLQPEYAWKNIQYWWQNDHVNPDGTVSAWQPQSKPIWFTEIGFPSVDGATNQPNVFYDPTSSESYYPYLSKQRIDFSAQREGLIASELQWQNSTMIPRRFVWTWDARPYPYWPDLRNVWADGQQWKTGHWVNGKFGISGLATIVAELCERAGFTAENYDVSRLKGNVEGFIINRQQTVRQSLELLMGAYFFDAVESGGQLKFVPRGGSTSLMVDYEKMVAVDNANQRTLLAIQRMQEIELPQQVGVTYLNSGFSYQSGHQIAQRTDVKTNERASLNFPIVMSQGQAQQIAEISLHTAWTGRTHFQFALPPAYIGLEPGDVITLQMQENTHTIRITQTTLSEGFKLHVQAVLEDYSTYHAYAQTQDVVEEPTTSEIISPTRTQLLDMPLLPNDNPTNAPLRVAMQGTTAQWRGATLFRSADNGQNWSAAVSTTIPAIMGSATALLQGDVNFAYLDTRSSLEVSLTGAGELIATTYESLINGANAARVGDEIIQFQHVELLSEKRYRLTHLLRGRLGTDWAINHHVIGEPFILLNQAILVDESSATLTGLTRDYRSVSIGSTIGQAASFSFTHRSIGLQPYAPVHVHGQRLENGTIIMQWKRRSRTEINWRDGVETPLNEASEIYEIEVLNGDEVVRSFTSFVPAATYTIAQQATDFTTQPQNITFRICQLSASFGKGIAATLTL